MIQWAAKNIGWKLSALALSTLVWIAMTADPPVTSTISAPVQYKNIPRELEMSSDVVDKVQLEVRGPSGKLTPAGLSDTAVVLDLSSVLRPGERTFPLREARIQLPPGVIMQQSIPNQIRLHFERRMVRDVPVEVRIANPPPSGYQIVSRRVVPPQLRIIGPESRVKELTHVDTDPLDLGGVVGTTQFSVQTYISDPRVRFESSGRVTVHVEVRKIDSSEN